MAALTSKQFPILSRPVRGHWAPVFLTPIMGSPERLVIGVIAINEAGYHVERANALARLSCLYGSAAETAIFAAELAFDELEADCAKRGMEALRNPSSNFSGVSIGVVSEGEASSLDDIARSWMASLSSLYDASAEMSLEMPVAPASADLREGAIVERLPTLVFDYVTAHRPGFESCFSEDIREHRQRRRTKVQSVIIDFAGSHLVANFGTLRASNRAESVDKIKRRILDLILNRDSESTTLTVRRHEMIVQHPAADDPQVSERQFNAITEVIEDVSVQARGEGITLVPATNVPQIGDHLIEAA